ncbi:MAG: hypothetical protein J1F02_07480 [Lachnospiraceae bacterium]|nr:hypothetical protein [Lachnospiraceae bacterium]
MKEFLSVLRTDFYRAFLSFGFVAGIIGAFAIFCFGSVGMMSQEASAVAVFNNTYKYNNISEMLFLAATFAYSSCFCVDWQTRFTYPAIIRSHKKRYMLSKCITAVIAGGMSVVVGTLLFIGAICIVQSSVLPSAIEIDMEFSPQAFGDLLMHGQEALFFFSYIYVIFWQAGFFSLLGLLASSYIPNKYAAYISPFILGFIMNQIANIVRLPIWLDPVKLSTVNILNLSTVRILLLVTATFFSFIVICSILFIRKAERRICNG